MGNGLSYSGDPLAIPTTAPPVDPPPPPPPAVTYSNQNMTMMPPNAFRDLRQWANYDQQPNPAGVLHNCQDRIVPKATSQFSPTCVIVGMEFAVTPYRGEARGYGGMTNVTYCEYININDKNQWFSSYSQTDRTGTSSDFDTQEYVRFGYEPGYALTSIKFERNNYKVCGISAVFTWLFKPATVTSPMELAGVTNVLRNTTNAPAATRNYQFRGNSDADRNFWVQATCLLPNVYFNSFYIQGDAGGDLDPSHSWGNGLQGVTYNSVRTVDLTQFITTINADVNGDSTFMAQVCDTANVDQLVDPTKIQERNAAAALGYVASDTFKPKSDGFCVPRMKARCKGATLESTECQHFCQDDGMGAPKFCQDPIKTHCATLYQTNKVAALASELCACSLPAQKYADDRIALANVLQYPIEHIDRAYSNNACLSMPCQKSKFKPTDTPPCSQSIQICSQIMTNIISAGGQITGDISAKQVQDCKLVVDKANPMPPAADPVPVVPVVPVLPTPTPTDPTTTLPTAPTTTTPTTLVETIENLSPLVKGLLVGCVLLFCAVLIGLVIVLSKSTSQSQSQSQSPSTSKSNSKQSLSLLATKNIPMANASQSLQKTTNANVQPRKSLPFNQK